MKNKDNTIDFEKMLDTLYSFASEDDKKLMKQDLENFTINDKEHFINIEEHEDICREFDFSDYIDDDIEWSK